MDVWTILYADENAAPASGGSVERRWTAALSVAESWGDRDHVRAVVLEQERPWWGPALAGYPAQSAVEQPFERGTAVGVLVALYQIQQLDPKAQVVVASCESLSAELGREIRSALKTTRVRLITATNSVGSSVWAVPNGEKAVATLISEPDPAARRYLSEHGALPLWPAVVAPLTELLALFEETQGSLSHWLFEQLRAKATLDQIYPFAAHADLFVDVLMAAPQRLDARFTEPASSWSFEPPRIGNLKLARAT